MICGRFLIGFGLTFAASAAPVLVTELAYPAQRGPVTSLYNTLWYVFRDNGCLSSAHPNSGSSEALCKPELSSRSPAN